MPGIVGTAMGILRAPVRTTGSLSRGLILAGLLVGLAAPLARAQKPQASTSTIYFYSLGDTNVADLWSGTLLPDFEKAYPQYKVKFVDILHGTGAQGALVSTASSRPKRLASQAWILMSSKMILVATTIPRARRASNYFTKVNTTNVPNIKLHRSIYSGAGWRSRHRVSLVRSDPCL